ncbi:hypothetical protein ACP70R_016693 [Stipagrostis hirtigluma subsp. patula]
MPFHDPGREVHRSDGAACRSLAAGKTARCGRQRPARPRGTLWVAKLQVQMVVGPSSRLGVVGLVRRRAAPRRFGDWSSGRAASWVDLGHSCGEWRRGVTRDRFAFVGEEADGMLRRVAHTLAAGGDFLLCFSFVCVLAAFELTISISGLR